MLHTRISERVGHASQAWREFMISLDAIDYLKGNTDEMSTIFNQIPDPAVGRPSGEICSLLLQNAVFEIVPETIFYHVINIADRSSLTMTVDPVSNIRGFRYLDNLPFTLSEVTGYSSMLYVGKSANAIRTVIGKRTYTFEPPERYYDEEGAERPKSPVRVLNTYFPSAITAMVSNELFLIDPASIEKIGVYSCPRASEVQRLLGLTHCSNNFVDYQKYLTPVSSRPVFQLNFSGPSFDEEILRDPPSKWRHFGASEIYPWLYLGDLQHGSDLVGLREARITHILNVCDKPTPEAVRKENVVKHISMPDHSDYDIAKHFHECVEYIDGVKKSRGTILVHCIAGISRSASMIIAYLIAKENMGYREAFSFLKEHRMKISPNLGFCLALRSLDPEDEEEM